MARIEFEDGTQVEFDGEPTQADIDYVAKELNIGSKPADVAAEKPKSFLQDFKEKTQSVLGFGADVQRGALKGFGSTLAGASALGEKGLAAATRGIGKLVGSETLAGAQPSGTGEFLQQQLRPKTIGEKIGFGAEQVAEFLSPVPGGAKAKLGSRIVGSALQGGGITAAQTGGDKESTITNTIISGALPIASALLKPLFSSAGLRIEKAIVKPSQADIKDGFNVKNIFKYDLGGTLQQTADKTHTKITELAGQLRTALGTVKKTIDLNRVLDSAKKELAQSRAGGFGMNTRIAKQLEFLGEEIAAVAKDGKVDISDAQQIKRSVGKLGAWQFGTRDPDANALERAANVFYTKLKQVIENVSPKNVKEINRQLSELIPIENALVRRIPIAERNNILGLGDIASLIPAVGGFALNPANLWLFALSRFAKSGLGAQGLMKAARPESGGLLKAGILGVPRTPEVPTDENGQ